MKLSSKNLLAVFITAILVVGSQTIIASERPSAETIKYWVENAINENLYGDTSGIKVDVTDGIVTLEGTVKNLAVKKNAELEAKKIRGVLGVIDKLTVMPIYRLDADIAQDVRHRIIDSAAIKSSEIKVLCTHGKVELIGKVASRAEREEAELLAGEVRGVKEVRNYLTVSWDKKRSDEAIKKDALGALRRDVYLTDLPIDVSVENGVIILTGSVGSDYEKARAADDVQWINNVMGLKNKLQIEWWEREGTRAKSALPTDSELCDTVTDALTHDSRLEPNDLVVTVSRGLATLEGSVANAYQKRMASTDARNVVGIGWVTNHLKVRRAMRDDSDISDEINFDISTDAALWNQKIDVKVKDGVVVLSGKVDTGPDKVHASMIASRIRGVKEIVNHIRVNWRLERADAALFKKVWDRIKSNWLLLPVESKIKVNVRKGVVTLTGTVYNWGERREAERVALKTNGVRFVDNQIHVEGYDYPYEDWKIANPDAPSWAYRDMDPYGG